MQGCIYFSFMLLTLVLAGSLAAGGQFSSLHPTASIDISALTIESDFTVFMRNDVPDDVRRSALRRLWVLMDVAVYCDELCYEPQPTRLDFARVASERPLPAAR